MSNFQDSLNRTTIELKLLKQGGLDGDGSRLNRTTIELKRSYRIGKPIAGNRS